MKVNGKSESGKKGSENDLVRWKEKYTAILKDYPFAVLEIDGEQIISCSSGAFDLLGLAEGQIPCELKEVFSEEQIRSMADSQGKVSDINLTLSGRKIQLDIIRDFGGNNYLLGLIPSYFELDSSGETSLYTDNPFQYLVKNSPDGICFINHKGIIAECNRSMMNIYELSEKKYLHKPVWELDFDFLPSAQKEESKKEQIRNEILNILKNPEKSGLSFEREIEVNNKIKYIQIRLFPFQSNQGLFLSRIITDITEGKNALLQLEKDYRHRTLDWQKSEARLKMLVETVPIAFYSFEKDNRNSIWYSEQIEYITGFTAEDLTKDPEMWPKRINKEDYETISGTFLRLSPNEYASVEYRWRDVKNQEIWIFDQAVLIPETDFHPALIVGCFMDISDRKQAEISIMESERNYREIFNSSNDSILILNAKSGLIEDVNLTMLSMFMTSYEEAIDSDLLQYSSDKPGYERKTIQKKFDSALVKEKITFEWLARRTDTTEFWVEIILKVIILNSEAKIMAVIRDINEKKETEEQLLINEEKYRLLVEGQTDLIIKYDASGKFLFASPSYCDLFDVPENELIGKKYNPVLHDDDIQTAERVIENLQSPPHSCYVEQRMKTRSGWRWIAWKNKAILDNKNKIREILAVGRDMTYQKGVEEALRSSEDRFRSIVQRLSDIVIICDSEANILYDTPSITRILGYKENFLIGQNLLQLIHEEERAFASGKLKEILTSPNETVAEEIRIRNASGEYVPMEGTGINLIHHPSIKGIVVTLRDITERKMLDKNILDAVIKTEEKERERFAKNLHDDLGPLLSSIKMYISSLSTARDPEKQEFIISQLNQVVKEAITSTKEVSNDLSPHILINYGLISAIENFIDKVPSNIVVNLECSLPADRYSNTIENSFYRIIKELINNTLKHARASQIDIKMEETGQELVLVYSDNGKGIDMSKLDPANNKGMGISNIISRAKSLGGNYLFQTKEGSGFSFNLTIPIHQSLE